MTSGDWLNDTAHLPPGFQRPEKKRRLNSKWYKPPPLKLTEHELKARVRAAEAEYAQWKAEQPE